MEQLSSLAGMASSACSPAMIAADIISATSRDRRLKVSLAACEELLTALTKASTLPVQLETSDLAAHLTAYLAHSLYYNWPWRRFSNLILVTDDVSKRMDAAWALEILLAQIRRLGYTDNLTKYVIRYPDNNYFCNRRYQQVMDMHDCEALKQRTLWLEASTYENRFILTDCSSKLREKICVTKCSPRCPVAATCWYKDFLDELRTGKISVQIYSTQHYIREMLSRQDGKRGRLPEHKTVMFLDDINTIHPIMQAASSKQMHPQVFYSFLLDCERLCGTKKSHKESVHAFAKKLHCLFEELLRRLRTEGNSEAVQRLFHELIAGMDVLQRKCWLLFRDDRRMETRRKRICALLCIFAYKAMSLYCDGAKGIVAQQKDSDFFEVLRMFSIQVITPHVPNKCIEKHTEPKFTIRD